MTLSVRNFPSPVTSIIGRHAEIAQLLGLLGQQSESRLVTVTGTGGVGKTRLVVEVLCRLEHSFADGIWLVELAPLNRAEQIVPRLAIVLGVEASGGVDLLGAITQFITTRELLLVFDNCEHLVDDLSVLLNTLLLHAPTLRVLCTSREAIHLPGEQRVALKPLETPFAATATHPANTMNADVIRLFGERAAAVSPGFVVSTANIGDIATICSTLDGIPLAVELAAAQVRIFTPIEIAKRLQTDLGFLENGRDAVARHHTLEAAIAWSENLLTPDEQLLLHRLSVFTNSAPLSAIESVCADASLPVSAILSSLTRLVDKSLVNAAPAGKQMRYSMLQTIQRVAHIGLAQRGEWNLIARRHAQWIMELARAGNQGLLTSESLQWVRRLEEEGGNLRQAIAYGIEHDLRLAADIISDLAWYWLWRNHMPEAHEWTRAVLTHPDAAQSPHIRARMLFTEAMSLSWSLDYDGAVTAAAESLSEARMADDQAFLTRIQEYYALTALYSGRIEMARQILDDADARDECEKKPLVAASQTIMRGLIARDSGDPAMALAIMEGGLHRLRAIGEPFRLCAHLYETANTYRANGDNQRAATLFRECHELAIRTQNAPILTLSFFGVAEMSQAGGKLSEALNWFEAGLEHLHGQGETPSTLVVRSLAYIAGEAGLHALSVSLFAAAAIPWPLQEALSAFVDTPYRQLFVHSHKALSDAEFLRAWRKGGYWSETDALQQGLSRLRTSLVEGMRATNPELQIRLLGRGQVLLSDHALEMVNWKYALARDLLFYLITVGERTREQIVHDFWPDVDAARARNRLNVTVHFLRRALGARHWIVFESNRYRFDPVGPYSCDVDDFYAATALAARIAQSQPAQAISSLKYAVSLVHGEFLEDVIEGEWHNPFRTAIHRDYQAALLQLANLQIDTGLVQNAIYTLSLALRVDPFAEETYRCLMRAHLLRRDLVQVMQIYRHLSELLEEEYGAPPTAETVALYQEIVVALRDEPSGGEASPQLKPDTEQDLTPIEQTPSALDSHPSPSDA